MWPVFVVVAAIDAENVLEMAATDDEDSVETISAERADPALGVSVRVGRGRASEQLSGATRAASWLACHECRRDLMQQVRSFGTRRWRFDGRSGADC